MSKSTEIILINSVDLQQIAQQYIQLAKDARFVELNDLNLVIWLARRNNVCFNKSSISFHLNSFIRFNESFICS